MPTRAYELARPSFTEWRATFFGPVGVSVRESADAAYRALAEAARAAGVEFFQEKTYCAAGTRDELGDARRRALESAGLDASTPWAFLRGREDVGPGEDARAVCVQLWGITRRAPGVRLTTVEAGRHRGRLLESAEVRMCWLGQVDGSDDAGALPLGVGAQTTAMLGRAERALDALGFTFRDVARTWIYVRELLADYRELNAARTAFYAARGIGRGSDETGGAKGKRSDGPWCVRADAEPRGDRAEHRRARTDREGVGRRRTRCCRRRRMLAHRPRGRSRPREPLRCSEPQAASSSRRRSSSSR